MDDIHLMETVTGHAVAQVVIRRIPIATARFRPHGNLYGIGDRQSGTTSVV
jgi:hypothetical protein